MADLWPTGWSAAWEGGFKSYEHWCEANEVNDSWFKVFKVFLSPGMDEWETFWKLKEHSGLEARRADLRTKE